MSRLEEIEARWAKVAPGRYIIAPPEDVAWLVARVRRLEAALRDIKSAEPKDGNTCVAAEALPEEEEAP